MRTLMWFRSDLRIADNKALMRGAELAGGTRRAPSRAVSKPVGHPQRDDSASAAPEDSGLVAVYLLSPTQWKEHHVAGIKVDLILRSLGALSVELARQNIPLLVRTAERFADAPGTLMALAHEHRCGTLVFNREYEINERRRDDAVLAAFHSAGLGAEAFHDQVLLPPGDVRTAEGKGGYYTVFSPFKRAYYRELEAGGLDEGVAQVLGTPAKQAETGIKPDKVPDRVSGFESHVPSARCEELWGAGEGAAYRRLRSFIDGSIGRYKELRDRPSVDATSVLSPYVSIGCVSPRQCLSAALGANRGVLDSKDPKLAGPTHWISELIWREFYRHIMVGFPRVCMGLAFRPATDNIRWDNNREHFEAWTQGRTGVPIVDAGMRQLLETGWMHNRVRMITAMYLTKDLFIDWRWGERHFMEHLIDGDLGQNNGGWQWSASTGTDAAPYFRIFNPVSQSRKFDTEGAYIRRYVPELCDLPGGENGEIHDPSEIPVLLRRRLSYPAPLVDRAIVRERVLTAFQSL